MRVKIILIFLTLKFNGFSQIIADTINYSIITYSKNARPHYKLQKITSGPKSENMHLSHSGWLEFRLYSDHNESYKGMFSCFKNNANYKTSDTIVYLEFDIEKYDKPINGHQWGILHFHRNNIITIDKVRNGGYMRREFKVYKWTKSEIILKDNSNKNLNRIYYLSKI